VLLPRVLEGGECDVLASDEVLHIFGRISLFLGREVVVEVDLFDLGFLLLGLGLFLELLVREQRPRSFLLLRTRVLLLDLLN
jgi:hypothetical protein